MPAPLLRRLSRKGAGVLYRDFERWGYDTKGWSARTRYKYSTSAKQADRWLVEHRGRNLIRSRPDDLKAYLFSLPPNARTRNNMRQALVAFGSYLLDQGYVITNHAVGLPRLPEASPLPKALPAHDAQILEAASKLADDEIRVLFLLMLYGGLRRSEARLLVWPSVDLVGGWIRFRGKGGRERSVPLHPILAASMRLWRQQSQSAEWVFSSVRFAGQPISETYLRRKIKEIGDAVGLDVHPHMLRHTAATRLMETGADLRTLQEYLGHADPKTTAIYTKVWPARLKEAVDRLSYRGDEDGDV